MIKRILVTGSTGFLGRHLMPILRARYDAADVVGVSSQDFDLLEKASTEHMLAVHRPDILVHLAAYSGGIGANRARPADFFYKNSLFVTLMFEAAAKAGVKKMIYTMGGCSYPATASSPISEDQMWNGYPQPESAGYSVAKKMGIVASTAYRQQYGLNSVVLIPGNMYGEYDNFREAESHVVPAMIRRYYEAKLRGDKQIVMWGDGSPLRDFVYAGDVAQTIPWFIDNYNSSEPVNISSGTETSIRQLAETIRSVMDWHGKIKWDADKPNGQMVKIFSVERLRALGLSCDTNLSNGLTKTLQWFTSHYSASSEGLRL
jgi:GDP-L-fucose synthase